MKEMGLTEVGKEEDLVYVGRTILRKPYYRLVRSVDGSAKKQRRLEGCVEVFRNPTNELLMTN